MNKKVGGKGIDRRTFLKMAMTGIGATDRFRPMGTDFYGEFDGRPRKKVLVNPSTPRPEGLGLPFDRLKALSAAEGLGVDPEPFDFLQGHEQVEWRRFFTALSKGGLPSTLAQAEGAPPNGSRLSENRWTNPHSPLFSPQF